MTTVESTLTPEARRATLAAVDRALRREAHVLAARPDLLWQQCYNRLQWEEEPVGEALAPELARRSVCGAAPWFRLRSRLSESEALVRVLAGHGGVVVACAVSPDGAFVVSASEDRTLKLWEVETGAERATLAGHEGEVLGCAVSPDGRFVVSASADRTLKLWEVETGAERATLAGHEGEV